MIDDPPTLSTMMSFPNIFEVVSIAIEYMYKKVDAVKARLSRLCVD